MVKKVSTAFLGLGSNLGNRISNLDEAKQKLETYGANIILASSLYETEPWGESDQPAFINQVVKIQTGLSAEELLQLVLNIEKKMGRERNRKWEPRIIDIDILFYNAEVIRVEGLSVPHPHLHERRFVLEPLAEIAGDFIHPGFKVSLGQLLRNLNDVNKVKRIEIS